ncbi:pyridoxal-phosphate dependent enzyme [Aquibacillus sp. 3ASR75-11]|uniref:Pyridoxal-phosphate dependent enzyme n=1 Tax=Terrihalobacillus insolitus TaxID=2950438 RepID=A0A9X3WZT5_9BACI|nr:pyridoxal-phosphate dependent enzyme [Terrihalobacillus insolitus]MDC3412991.1 pyridoxal-phosphate dependent enzyme [Terrihalobacillus insolitus]MDC3426304.1 pyridoxal-phosphate dependent enzyme [Terrihalobacillus insolitus]
MEHWPFQDYELPRIDRISNDFYAASFFLMKLLPARYMLQKAVEEKIIRPGGKIIESTSGTFGLALAMICAAKDFKLTLVSDPAIDTKLQSRLADLGVDLKIVDKKEEASGGFQNVRLQLLKDLLKQEPEYYWPRQYDNPYNPASYAKLAEFLVARLGKIDALIGPVGSGGSMVGSAKALKTVFPDLQVVGIDTPYSVLFGQPNGIRPLRGLGNSILPLNLEHSIFDIVSWVPAEKAFHFTRQLHREHGLFMGPTSGASYLVAKWYKDNNPGKKIVSIFPDEGNRYIDTVYSDIWLKSNGFIDNNPIQPPKLVDHPIKELKAWSVMHWNGRSLGSINHNDKLLINT